MFGFATRLSGAPMWVTPSRRPLRVIAALVVAASLFGGCGGASDSLFRSQLNNTCASGAVCGEVCIDTQTSSSNCGGCGHVCADGAQCVAGICVGKSVGSTPTCVTAGFTPCGGQCTDPTSDANNCGACGTVCASGATCSSGQCVAAIPQPDACSACTSNQRCEAGQCLDNSIPVERQHQETAVSSSHVYTVEMKGTIDSVNTRNPIGYIATLPGFEPNRFVQMSNVGAIPVVNPWLRVDGAPDFRSSSSVVNSVVDPRMTDRQKAIALWAQHIGSRFHATTDDADNDSVAKLYNVYGYGICGDSAFVLGALFGSAGLSQVRYPYLNGHVIPEVWFDNRWNLLDGDEDGLYLLRDNHTVASNADIVRDHDLVKRSHTYGALSAASRSTDEFAASVFYINRYNTMSSIWGVASSVETMNMTLRPGESLEWRWGAASKYHGLDSLSDWGADAAANLANGSWTYVVDFTQPTWSFAAQAQSNTAADKTGLHSTQGMGTIVIPMSSPYVFVGGQVLLRGAAKVYLSWDATTWQQVPASSDGAGLSLDGFFPSTGAARYAYYLRVDVGTSPLNSLTIQNDVQMAPLAMPGLRLGTNYMVYEDQTTDPHAVQITQGWTESYANTPPNPVQTALFPRDQSTVTGTQLTFGWQAPIDPDGDAVVDYEFLLSDSADARWPLSSNFHRLVSLTPDAGLAQYTLPYSGLLNSDTSYYWKVRARDGRGAWSAWSPVFTFQTKTPQPPENVTVVTNAATWTATLTWNAPSAGNTPTSYRIYGSDEQGFTVSDAPYDVWVGNQGAADTLSSPFASNFIVELPATSTSYPIVGPTLTGPGANHPYYRIVAVDANGLESGPSDFGEVPRPYFYTLPVTTAKVGHLYSYQARSISSLGDLTSVTTTVQPYAANYWNIEKLVYTFTAAPAWLTVDPTTGLVSGTPTAAGTYGVGLLLSDKALGQREQYFAITVTN